MFLRKIKWRMKARCDGRSVWQKDGERPPELVTDDTSMFLLNYPFEEVMSSFQLLLFVSSSLPFYFKKKVAEQLPQNKNKNWMVKFFIACSNWFLMNTLPESGIDSPSGGRTYLLRIKLNPFKRISIQQFEQQFDPSAFPSDVSLPRHVQIWLTDYFF